MKRNSVDLRKDINIRKINEGDYECINNWWLENNLPIPELKHLPENGLGGLIIEKEKPIAAAYIYTTNSSMGYIDFLISDPNYKRKDRYDIILELFKACTKASVDLGSEAVWAMTSDVSVIDRALKIGWEKWGNPQTIITHKNNKQ